MINMHVKDFKNYLEDMSLLKIDDSHSIQKS